MAPEGVVPADALAPAGKGHEVIVTVEPELAQMRTLQTHHGRFVNISNGSDWEFLEIKICEPMIAQNTEPEVITRPEFKEAFGDFQVIFYRDWLTEERLKEPGLNGRLVKAVLYAKEKGSITNREMFGISAVTAARDLKGLVDAGIFEKTGRTVRGVRYILRGQTGQNDPFTEVF